MTISASELAAFIEQTYAMQGIDASLKKSILPKKYGITIPALAVGGTVTQQIQIGANGDFFLTRILFRASLAGAAQTISSVPVPNVRALFTDSGSDEQWANQAIDLSQWGSLGGNVYAWQQPYPRCISGRSTVSAQFTSFEAANTPVLDVTFDGVFVKIFK